MLLWPCANGAAIERIPMRAFTFVVASALAVMAIVATVAYADGVKRPHVVRQHRHVEVMGPPVAPAPAMIEQGLKL